MGAIPTVTIHNPDDPDSTLVINEADFLPGKHHRWGEYKPGKPTNPPLAAETPIEDVPGLAASAAKILREAGVNTVDELRALSDADLEKIEGLSQRAHGMLKEVRGTE